MFEELARTRLEESNWVVPRYCGEPALQSSLRLPLPNPHESQIVGATHGGIGAFNAKGNGE
jgi:hypothetical protein